MNYSVFNQTYDVTNAPAFVRHAILLITRRWGTALSNGTVPDAPQHKANDLGRRFGVVQ
jgi:hypothetical protein